MAASTLGDIMMTPPVEWEAFAKEWVILGGRMLLEMGSMS